MPINFSHLRMNMDQSSDMDERVRELYRRQEEQHYNEYMREREEIVAYEAYHHFKIYMQEEEKKHNRNGANK